MYCETGMVDLLMMLKVASLRDGINSFLSCRAVRKGIGMRIPGACLDFDDFSLWLFFFRFHFPPRSPR